VVLQHWRQITSQGWEDAMVLILPLLDHIFISNHAMTTNAINCKGSAKILFIASIPCSSSHTLAVLDPSVAPEYL